MFDKAYVLDIAERLLKTSSPSGYYERAISLLEKEVEKLGFSYVRNQKGNLLITVKGKSEKKHIGVCGHTDTLGLMVRSIKEDGKLAITVLGGPLLNTLDGEYCSIITRSGKEYTGTILSISPSSHVYTDSKTIAHTEENLEVRLDEVVKNKEDVEVLGIQNGDIIAIDPKTIITESEFIKSRFIDDKVSVAIMFGVMKELVKNLPAYNTTFMITTYEEVGHGNSWIPSDITELLGVDMGCIGMDLACSEYDVSICAKDSSGPYDYDMTSLLIELAKANELSYAVDIYPFYGSDVSAALRGGNNIKGALIGPGVHASHGMERTHYLAVENTMKLLYAYLQYKE
jgi:Cellulase M and related proteins